MTGSLMSDILWSYLLMVLGVFFFWGMLWVSRQYVELSLYQASIGVALCLVVPIVPVMNLIVTVFVGIVMLIMLVSAVVHRILHTAKNKQPMFKFGHTTHDSDRFDPLD